MLHYFTSLKNTPSQLIWVNKVTRRYLRFLFVQGHTYVDRHQPLGVLLRLIQPKKNLN